MSECVSVCVSVWGGWGCGGGCGCVGVWPGEGRRGGGRGDN